LSGSSSDDNNFIPTNSKEETEPVVEIKIDKNPDPNNVYFNKHYKIVVPR